MKIILTGATGFVGGEILKQLIADPAVTQISCVTRRIVNAECPKVKLVVRDNFMDYDSALLDDLADHSACIWALGGKASDLGTPDVFEQITYGFTLSLAAGLAKKVNKPFTFCYLSGMGADQSESAWLPWEKLTRHLKGRTEKHLNQLQEEYPNFAVHSFRPGGILPVGPTKWWHRLLDFMIVRVDDLARAMIKTTRTQYWGKDILVLNSEIKQLAK